jgi:crotonobetainyl-CoA:carnitine CoA-transferase CaiB-like acyl-CoA transferase
MKPLEDVRIIAVEQYGAGPFGSVHLADLGAQVIKIEDPRVGGDVSRYVPPNAEGQDSLFFEAFNRNKSSVSVDLSTESGRQVFEDLVRVSDVVYSNLRGDVPAKIGLTYEQLKNINPAIVCCSLSGFGMSGPRRDNAAYDYILQGLAGWMDLTGEPGGPPAKTGLSLVDYTGGLVAIISLLAGLHSARRDGVGMDCDVSLYDVAIGMLTYPAIWYLNAGTVAKRTKHSAHPSLVPFQNFQTSDGWIVVACAKEKFWQRLATVIGQPEWGDAASEYGSFEGRRVLSDTLIEQLEVIFLTKTSAHWLGLLEGAGVPCGPINDVAGALADEHTVARGLIVETDHPRFGRVKQVASPVRVGSVTPEYRRAPRLNEDFDLVVRDILGYDDVEILRLRASGAFGDAPEPDARRNVGAP